MPQHATPVLGMRVHGDEGGEVHFDAKAHGAPALAWIVDVQALQERLADALRYQPLVEWLDAPQPAALTVICEGKASITPGRVWRPIRSHALRATRHCRAAPL